MLIGMTSIWLLCLLQHLPMVMGSGEYLPAFNPAFDRTDDGTPVVTSVAVDRVQGGEPLYEGDRLIALNGESLANITPIQFQFDFANSLHQRSEAVFTVQGGGQERTVRLEPSHAKITWSHLPPVIGYVVIAILVMLRAPNAPGSRIFFAAFMSIAIFQTGITSGSGYQVVGGRFLFILMGMISFALALLWLISFSRPPRELDTKPRVPVWVAFIVPVLFALPRLNYYVDGPLAPENYIPHTYAVDVLFTLLVIGTISWNYYCADAVNRRKIRWVMIGVYLAFVPMLLIQFTGALFEVGEWFLWVQNFGLLFYAAVPISLFMAMRHYNLFDVDRLISGSIAYTILIVLFALMAESVVEPVAAQIAVYLGADAETGQLLFVGALAAFAIPIQSMLRPRIEALFFPGQQSFRDAIEALIDTVANTSTEDLEEVALVIGTRISELLGLQDCAVYLYENDTWTPVFKFGQRVDLDLSNADALELKDLIERRTVPIRLKGGSDKEASYAKLFRGLDVELVIPIRSEDEQFGFVCLGRKNSRDVYTNTDLSLLAGVAAQVTLSYSAG